MMPRPIRLWSNPVCRKLLSIGAISAILTPLPPAQAAEQIVLKYSILRESISVAELGELSRTGKVSPALKSYLSLAKKDPKDLQQWLNKSVRVSPTTLSPLLNSFAGGFVLDQVGEVIHTPSKRANREALRGAIITASLNDNRVQLIEVLEHYPTQEVHLEGDRLMELYKTMKDLQARLPKLPF